MGDLSMLFSALLHFITSHPSDQRSRKQNIDTRQNTDFITALLLKKEKQTKVLTPAFDIIFARPPPIYSCAQLVINLPVNVDPLQSSQLFIYHSSQLIHARYLASFNLLAFPSH